jgi:hypothetical protein
MLVENFSSVLGFQTETGAALGDAHEIRGRARPYAEEHPDVGGGCLRLVDRDEFLEDALL